MERGKRKEKERRLQKKIKKTAKTRKTKMETFNLKNNLFEKTAMGSTHRKNRPALSWWNIDELETNPPEDWNKFIEQDPSMKQVVLVESSIERDKRIKCLTKMYDISWDQAKKLERTYIGYNPSLGGYACYVGPYISRGERWGEQAIRQPAKNTFNYHMFRKGQLGEDDFAAALFSDIRNYQKKYGIQFAPEDFDLILNVPKEVSENKTRAKYDKIKLKAGDANGNISQEVKSALYGSVNEQGKNTGSFIGKGSRTVLNNDGHLKILTSKEGLSEWSDSIINAIALEKNMSREDILSIIKNDYKLLRRIYTETYKKWKMAFDNGEAAAIGMPPPPTFADAGLSRLHRSQSPQETKPQTVTISKLKLKKEISRYMIMGLNSEEISEELNNDPKRKEVEHIKDLKRARAEAKGYPINPADRSSRFTSEEIQRNIDEITKESNDLGVKTSALEPIFDARINTLEKSYGFTDMKSAMEAAAMINSGLPTDSVTGAPIGTSTVKIFDAPPDFENYHLKDLIGFEEKKIIKEMQMSPEELEKKRNEEKEAIKQLKETDEDVISEQEKQEINEEAATETFEIEDKIEEDFEPEIKTEQEIAPETFDVVEIEPKDQPISQVPAIKTDTTIDDSKKTTKKPKTTPKPKAKPIPIPKPEPKSTKPKPQSKPKSKPKVENKEPQPEPDAIAQTLKNLIRIASELDSEDKNEEAEEIHKIIRKYI